MDHKTFKTIERPSGIGKLSANGKHRTNVEYQLQVIQVIIILNSMDGPREIPGVKSIFGRITLGSDERNENSLLREIMSGKLLDLLLDDRCQLNINNGFIC